MLDNPETLAHLIMIVMMIPMMMMMMMMMMIPMDVTLVGIVTDVSPVH